jgi:hypothetical protein
MLHACGRRAMHVGVWRGNKKEKDLLENLGAV